MLLTESCVCVQVRAADVTCAVETHALRLERDTMLSVFGPLEEAQRYCLLRKVPALAFLDDARMHKITKCIQPMMVQPGEYLTIAGGTADATFIVESGEVVLMDEQAKSNVTRLRRGSLWRNTGI